MIRFPFVTPRGGRSEDEPVEVRPQGPRDETLGDEPAPLERIRLGEDVDDARADDAGAHSGASGAPHDAVFAAPPLSDVIQSAAAAAHQGPSPAPDAPRPEGFDPSEDEADDRGVAGDTEEGVVALASGDADRPPLEEQIRMVEAMLFASERPLSTAELASRMPIGCDAAVAVRRLEQMYEGRGVSLARVAGKWAFRTAPDLAHLLTGESVEQRKLSRAAIETLAIVAYHQPVTRAEIEEIRQVGVSKGTLDLLMELEWIKLGRRRQTPGRPVTFVTTDRFLEHFGLETLKDLPRLEELRQAGLLDAAPPKGFAPKLGGSAEDDLDADLEDEEDAVERDGPGDRQTDLLV